MKNHINGMKIKTAFKTGQKAFYFLPLTLNQAIVLESAISHESLFAEHITEQKQIQQSSLLHLIDTFTVWMLPHRLSS